MFFALWLRFRQQIQLGFFSFSGFLKFFLDQGPFCGAIDICDSPGFRVQNGKCVIFLKTASVYIYIQIYSRKGRGGGLLFDAESENQKSWKQPPLNWILVLDVGSRSEVLKTAPPPRRFQLPVEREYLTRRLMFHCSCFGLCVSFLMSFKSRVDLSSALFLACVRWSWRNSIRLYQCDTIHRT